MLRKKYLTQREIEDLMNESSEEEETATLIRSADKVDLVLLPPSRVDEISDCEDIDDNIQVLNDLTCIIPQEVAG